MTAHVCRTMSDRSSADFLNFTAMKSESLGSQREDKCLTVLTSPLLERVRTDCRLRRTFVRETSSIESSAIRCNSGWGTCLEACFSSQMGLRRHFMIPEVT